MVSFWDTSSLVPLLVDEPTTGRVQKLYDQQEKVVVWWSTRVECASAIARREREDKLANEEAGVSLGRLDAFAKDWFEIEPSDELRDFARRYLRTHPLRAANALQLAAAFAASEHRPPTLEFVTLDDRLRLAAEKEGFQVVEV